MYTSVSPQNASLIFVLQITSERRNKNLSEKWFFVLPYLGVYYEVEFLELFHHTMPGTVLVDEII